MVSWCPERRNSAFGLQSWLIKRAGPRSSWLQPRREERITEKSCDVDDSLFRASAARACKASSSARVRSLSAALQWTMTSFGFQERTASTHRSVACGAVDAAA